MEGRKRTSLLIQVVILFVIGILLTGVFSYFSSRNLSDVSVRSEVETHAASVSEEVKQAIKEYPAYNWLLSYYATHAEDMDIEYDVDYVTGTKTEKKCRELAAHHPDLQIKYATVAEIEAMSKADQKLYAEITYSWIITRLNQIMRSNNLAFLFCVLTDENFDKQFFLLSAASEGAERGTEYEQVYPLGTESDVSLTQSEGMRSATQNNDYLSDAGKYLDYYSYLDDVNDQIALLGMTYGVSEMKSEVLSETTRDIALTMCIEIILALVCLALLYYVALRPLKEVQENIRMYKETKDSKAVIENLKNFESRNEIGQLSEDVTELAKEMDDYVEQIETITAKEERIGAELDMSRRIQRSMLPCTFPAFPNRNEFEVFASMEPAREVGGDFYDFYMIDDDHLGMVVADVSGKGIPAALFMVVSKIIVQSVAMMGGSAGEILTKTNEAICSNNESDMFVTVWIGVLEISTGKITAANAGHEYPVIRKADGMFEVFKDKHGLVVGGFEGFEYEEYELQLEPGDKLFLYTDGVPEAADEDKRMFGMDRMLVALNKDPDAKPEDILHNVREAVDEFVKGAEQFDDLTMMCLEYKGNQ